MKELILKMSQQAFNEKEKGIRSVVDFSGGMKSSYINK
jgi:hypothetical protein